MATPLPAAHQPPVLLRWLLRVTALLWLGFWLWFVTVNLLDEFSTEPLPMVAALLVAGLLPWWRADLGGVGLLAFGVWSAVRFANPGAIWLMSVPAAAIGLLALLVAWRERDCAARPAGPGRSA